MSRQRIVILCYFTAVIVGLEIPRCWTAAHYCKNGGDKMVDISHELGQDEKLPPKVDAPSTPADGIRCKWEAAALKLDDTALVLVTAFNVSQLNSRRVRRSTRAAAVTASSSSSMYYQQLGPEASCSGHMAVDPERVDFGTFHVLQLPKGGYLSVTYESKSPVPDAKLPAGVMMLLVEAGFCSREMTSFQRSCYLVSPKRLSLREELERLNGNSKILQLASFHSLEAIRQFVEANKQTAVFVGGAMRSKVPLNLSEPVRIGLFYSRADRTIKFINSTGGQCLLQNVTDPEIIVFIDTALAMDSAYACGSLRVDQRTGREVLEFRNCSEQLPTLISFADSPRTACGNCSEPVLEWLKRLAGSDDASNEAEVPIVKPRSLMVIGTSVAAALCLCIFVIVIVAVSCFCPTSRSYARKKCSMCQDKETHVSHVRVSVDAGVDSLLFRTEVEQSGDKTRKSMNNGISGQKALLVDPAAFSSLERKVPLT